MTARFLGFAGVLALLGAYTGLHAAQLAPAHPGATLAGSVAFVEALLAWQLLYRADRFPHESAWARAAAWTHSVALGAWSAFLFFCAAADLATLAGMQAAWAARAAAAAAVAVAVLGVLQALRGPRVVAVDVPVKGLAAGLDGLRIAQITDLHVGPTIRRAQVQAVVEKTLSLAPDLVAVTGDLVDGEASRLAPHVAPLAALRAPLGVYYVPGNHEYYWDARAWLSRVEELGMVPLLNDSRLLERGGARLRVGGVPDETGSYFIKAHAQDFARAAVGDADFKLLLAHRPTGADAADKAGFGLQLSGHTHGGQFFPWSLVIGLFHRYARGLHRHGGLWLYVCPGTGYWGPALRFGVPAEIALLTLRRA